MASDVTREIISNYGGQIAANGGPIVVARFETLKGARRFMDAVNDKAGFGMLTDAQLTVTSAYSTVRLLDAELTALAQRTTLLGKSRMAHLVGDA